MKRIGNGSDKDSSNNNNNTNNVYIVKNYYIQNNLTLEVPPPPPPKQARVEEVEDDEVEPYDVDSESESDSELLADYEYAYPDLGENEDESEGVHMSKMRVREMERRSAARKSILGDKSLGEKEKLGLLELNEQGFKIERNTNRDFIYLDIKAETSVFIRHSANFKVEEMEDSVFVDTKESCAEGMLTVLRHVRKEWRDYFFITVKRPTSIFTYVHKDLEKDSCNGFFGNYHLFFNEKK